MFVVTIENNGVKTEIHGEHEKLSSGKIVKGINAIDSFSFSIHPFNVGFDLLHSFTTLVAVYNTNRDRYEFLGRVLYSDTTMDESGLIAKEVTCESFFGFLCDSQQSVVGTQNWTVNGLLQHIIDKHNSQVEPYKRFTIGEVTVTDPNDNLYLGIQYANTWDTIKAKLIDKLGGEIRFRVMNDVIYLDYLTEIGKVSDTEIAVSRNMKSIKQEKDPSSYITRLIPLGMKMGENDERMEITSVNNGKNYIDDENAIAEYGIHVGYVEWDDVTVESNLLRKGQEWLRDNNKLLVKYSITALDLSLLELDIDDFDVGNYHPLKNHLIGVDDVARIVKKNIDICEEIRSTIEIGDNLKSMSDIQISQAQETAKIYSKITKTDEEIRLEVKNELEKMETMISQTSKDLTLSASCEDGEAKIVLSATGENGSSVELSSDTFNVNVKAMNVSGELTAATISADNITAGTLSGNNLKVDAACVTGTLTIGALPSGVAMDSDIPTHTSDLTNNSGFVNSSTVTTITNNAISTAYISADRITAGDLDADVITLSSGYGGFGIAYGSYADPNTGKEYTTYGAKVYGSSDYNYLIVTNSGVRMQSSVANFFVSGTTIKASHYIEETSDRRLKQDISYGVEKYRSFLRKLKPSLYRYKTDTTSPLLCGFIAQDVEEALTESGMTRLDFAGICGGELDKETGEPATYGLAYTQFVALLTDAVQDLYSRIEAIENNTGR